MTTAKAIREITAQIESFGNLHITRVKDGTHPKFYLETPAGKKVFTGCISASDRKAVHNNLALFRRWERGDE